MYTQPPPLKPKPFIGKTEQTQNIPPGKSFLHGSGNSNRFSNKQEKNANDSKPGFPTKPSQLMKPQPHKLWEQKEAENEPSWKRKQEVKKIPLSPPNKTPGTNKIGQNFNAGSKNGEENSSSSWSKRQEENKEKENTSSSLSRSVSAVGSGKIADRFNAMVKSNSNEEQSTPSWVRRPKNLEKDEATPSPQHRCKAGPNSTSAPPVQNKPSWLKNQTDSKCNEDNENDTDASSSWKNTSSSFSDPGKRPINNLGRSPSRTQTSILRNAGATNVERPNVVSETPFKGETVVPTATATPEPENMSSGRPIQKKSSFLFRNQPRSEEKENNKTSPIKPNTSLRRRKRQLPPDVYQKPPPPKPRKPTNARLPYQETASMTKNPMPPPRPVKSSDLLPAPPSPSAFKNLPAVPGRPLPPLSPVPSNDVYDDTSDPLPPPPPSTHPQIVEEVEEIPTWDDEIEAVYDDTPEAEFIPPDEEGDEMYEDLDHYKEFRNRAANNLPNENAKNEEKKEVDKKEKKARKNFNRTIILQLPLEGEVPVEFFAYVKKEVRGSFKSVQLHTNEKVDVIRSNNNPKGKWLVRTNNGTYIYADSDHLSREIYDKRPPPAPAQNFFRGPPPPPSRDQGQDEGDAVYDESWEDGDLVYETF